MYDHLERRRNIWGLGYDQRQKFVAVRRASRPSTRPGTTCSCGWAARGRSRPTIQKSLRSLFGILRARTRAASACWRKEQCTGDPAKRTGNEYMFQELANANIEDLKNAGPKKILYASCPHCVKTIGDDYRRFGYEVRDRPFVGVRRRV